MISDNFLQISCHSPTWMQTHSMATNLSLALFTFFRLKLPFIITISEACLQCSLFWAFGVQSAYQYQFTKVFNFFRGSNLSYYGRAGDQSKRVIGFNGGGQCRRSPKINLFWQKAIYKIKYQRSIIISKLMSQKLKQKLQRQLSLLFNRQRESYQSYQLSPHLFNLKFGLTMVKKLERIMTEQIHHEQKQTLLIKSRSNKRITPKRYEQSPIQKFQEKLQQSKSKSVLKLPSIKKQSPEAQSPNLKRALINDFIKVEKKQQKVILKDNYQDDEKKKEQHQKKLMRDSRTIHLNNLAKKNREKDVLVPALSAALNQKQKNPENKKTRNNF